MLKTRIIPVLLLHENVLHKTVKYKNPVYVGDPINAIKIFNEKEVDELIIVDIDASKNNSEPDYKFIEDVASECFMPLCYGGGVKTLKQAAKIFSIGVEKVVIENAGISDQKIIKEITETFGTQSVVGSISVNKNIFGKHVVYDHVTNKNLKIDPIEHAKKLIGDGVGEIFINTVYKDGTMSGYDVEYLKKISSAVDVPLIACGGASTLEDFKSVVDETEVSALGAGSMFVFHGKHKAVLIKYPDRNQIEKFVG